MNCPYNVKVCTKCGRILIACEMNFRKDKKGKYGFSAICKECKREQDRKWREENKEYKRERDRKYREENKEKIKEKGKRYREKNKEIIVEKKKQHYKENREYYAEYNRKYREEHSEELKEKKKQYYEENPHVAFNSHNKRRDNLENQGNGISKEQWLEMMKFFDFRCAYSGEVLGDKNVRSIDHIIPINNGGEHEVWNCVPMYKPYNSSKHANDMEEWYRKQDFFSEERLQKIYEWCEYAWNKWGYDED